jgi:hypothetical protein
VESQLFKITELQSRYGLSSKQAVYDRIHKIGMIPIAKGYISSEQLELMDKLDKHLKSGGTFKDWGIIPEVELQTLPTPTELSEASNDGYLKAFEWMGGIIEKMLVQQTQVSPLARFEELEKAVKMGIILPTSAIAQLIKTKPRGDNFVYGSYTIVRKGKVGRESGWLVSKILPRRKLTEEEENQLLFRRQTFG